MHVTFFRDAAAKRLTIEQMTLQELRAKILATTAAEKSALPWLKLARFGDNRAPGSCSLRHNANVAAISGAECDYDGGKGSLDAAVRILKQVGVRALIYTSPSHTVAKPRWRILAPASKELPPQRRAQLVARINGLFGGAMAPESFVLSQAYYYGSVARNPAHRAVVVDGDCIDKRRDLDDGAVGGRIEKTEPAKPRAAINHDPIDWDQIAAALEVIPADGYHPWLRVGAALFFEFGDDGFPLFDWWSSKSHKYNEEAVARKWRECQKFTQYTGATILYYADQVSPHWRGIYQARTFAALYSMRAR